MARDAPFIPDPQHRVVSPALNLDPSDTPPNLYAGTLAYFNAIPWCAAHLQVPGVIPFVPASCNPASTLDNQILGSTLASERAVPYMLCFLEPADAAHALHPTRPFLKAHSFFATGDGLAGYPGVVQGGIVMALMDEAMGAVLELNMVLRKEGAAFQTNSVTASMDMKFLKPVPTKKPIHAVAWIESIEGRRTKMSCKVVDENGTELAKCTSRWVALRANF